MAVDRHPADRGGHRAARRSPASSPARSSHRRPRRTRPTAASPARSSAPWARPACSGCPTPRSTAAAASPTRSTCRWSRSWPASGDRRPRASACTPWPASRWREFGTEEQRPAGCPTWSAASCSAPTACPSRSPARTPPRCAPAPCATATTTSSTAPRPGSPMAARPTSTACSCRTSDDGAGGISCLLVDGATPGDSAAEPEHKMGFTAPPPRRSCYDDARVAADRLLGAEGQGFKIALAALDGGRLGIAACAVGLAQAALDAAVGLRPGAPAVRPPLRRVPGPVVPAGRHGDRGGGRPRAVPRCGPAPRPRASRSASRRRWPSCSAPTWRCG